MKNQRSLFENEEYEKMKYKEILPMIERYEENVNQLQIDMNKVRGKYQRILVLMSFDEVSRSVEVSQSLI